MHDAVEGVPSFPAETFVEANAEAAKLLDATGSGVCQEIHGAAPAQTATRGQRVRRVEGGIVVRADCRRNAALRGVAVRGRVGGLCEHEHGSAGVCCCERGGETSDAGSDDGNVRRLAFLSHNR
jgi:hypothetical protein